MHTSAGHPAFSGIFVGQQQVYSALAQASFRAPSSLGGFSELAEDLTQHPDHKRPDEPLASHSDRILQQPIDLSLASRLQAAPRRRAKLPGFIASRVLMRFNMLRSTIAASALSLALSGNAAAVEYASADVMVKDVAASLSGERFTCEVTVHVNGAGDDSARNVNLVVVLPLEVKIAGRLPAACRAVLITGGTGTWASHVVCQWALINRRTSQAVKITTTKSRHPRSKSCGGLVWNHVPDPDPSNNSRTATAP